MTLPAAQSPAAPSLEELGWDEQFAAAFAPHQDEGLAPARITTEHRGAYVLECEHGDLAGELAGRLRHAALGRGELPAVGDWVAIAPRLDERRATIHALLPRKTKFSRKTAWNATEEQVVAANVDVVFVVSALAHDFNLRRLERYLTLAWESGATPAIVLNKSDLCEDVPARVLDAETVAFGVPIHVTSCATGEGIADLRGYLEGNRTVALLGSSGVGKSSLLNRLAGADVQMTKEVRSDGRGRHATTARQLFRLPGGGLILDTPGMRELQLWDASEGIDEAFQDIARLAAECRFRDCAHRHEPGCAVLAALLDGTLAPERMANYRSLQRELARLERKQNQRAAAEARKRWRAIAKEHRQRNKWRW